MKLRRTDVTRTFIKAASKLTKQEKILLIEKREIFEENPFDPRLKTHKLSGKLAQKWSFSLNYSTRVVFVFIQDDIVVLLDVGTHKVYK